MSSSAQLDPVSEPQDLFAGGEGSAAVLKQFAAERLAAHRSRRGLVAGNSAVVEQDTTASLEDRVPGAARVREAVAARYQQSLSYHEYLAAEAERSMQQARAEAEASLLRERYPDWPDRKVAECLNVSRSAVTNSSAVPELPR